MTFGKPGRPPEDRLLRQREIFLAVAPLIMRDGARRLSMRAAAHAACLSIGGLYYYFPTKRDLVLHGLRAEARARLCADQRAALARLSTWSLERFIEAYLDHTLEMLRFVQPSVRAALDLGAEELQGQLDGGLAANVTELAESLRLLAPELPAERHMALGRAIRRVALGTLIDRNADEAEVRGQLRALIEGCLASAATPAARVA